MSCLHDTTLIDTSTGDQICTSCGICLQSVIFGMDIPQSSVLRESKRKVPKEYEILLEFTSKANLPEIYATTAYSYHKKLNSNKKNMSLETRLYASMYRALNYHGTPFSLHEMCGLSGLSSKELSHAYKKMFSDKGIVTNMCLRPSMFITRFCSKLNLPRHASNRIFKELKAKEEKLCMSKNPATIAAKEIFQYCQQNNENISLKMICNVCGVSETSVYRCMKK